MKIKVVERVADSKTAHDQLNACNAHFTYLGGVAVRQGGKKYSRIASGETGASIFSLRFDVVAVRDSVDSPWRPCTENDKYCWLPLDFAAISYDDRGIITITSELPGTIERIYPVTALPEDAPDFDTLR
jgi:hypothetical protein